MRNTLPPPHSSLPPYRRSSSVVIVDDVVVVVVVDPSFIPFQRPGKAFPGGGIFPNNGMGPGSHALPRLRAPWNSPFPPSMHAFSSQGPSATASNPQIPPKLTLLFALHLHHFCENNKRTWAGTSTVRFRRGVCQ